MRGCLPITKTVDHCSILESKVLGHEIVQCTNQWMFKLTMDTVARVIAEVELLHCEGILVECIFRIFSQALLMFALLAYYRKLVMVDK